RRRSAGRRRLAAFLALQWFALQWFALQGPTPAAAQTNDVAARLAAGEQALRSGNLERARDSFLGVLQQSADNQKALLALGRIYYTVGAFAEAETYLRRA